MNPESLIIRDARLNDLAEIIQLDEKLFRYDEQFDDTLDFNWSKSEEGVQFFKDRIKKKEGMIVVAEYNGNVIGYLAGAIVEAYSYRRVKKLAELECMFVESDYRRLKAGSNLVQAFMDWVVAENIHNIRIEASAGNVDAVAFYKRLGFKEYNLILEGTI